jgi:BioD-like phosphotransacetylase family protein
MSVKKLFLGATRQNDGKTAISLGLIYALSKKIPDIGFIKPVGQRYQLEKGEKIDEDALLIKKVCNLKGNLKDMSPIAIERGFTERYISTGRKQTLVKLIRDSFKQIAKGKNLVLIEGTGHAGVGSVFDLSNARVASLLKTKVVIVSEGGIGRPIDEIMLSKAFYDKEKVEIAGVIINKVLPGKYKRISQLVKLGLKRKGLRVLGVIPYYKILSKPTVSQILEEESSMKLLCGKDRLGTPVDKVMVGAMEPHEALSYISNNSLVITPGDREDIMLTCMSSHLAADQTGVNISGIILTGGIKPHKSIMDLIKKSGIPVLLAKEDTYAVTSKIHDLIIKVKPDDKKKAERIKKMVENYVDLDLLYESL